MKNLEEPSCYDALKKAEEKNTQSIFDYRELKCFCSDLQQEKDGKKADDGYILSTGETFIQYYYLCQRRVF